MEETNGDVSINLQRDRKCGFDLLHMRGLMLVCQSSQPGNIRTHILDDLQVASIWINASFTSRVKNNSSFKWMPRS
jgi:hypothetical protein